MIRLLLLILLGFLAYTLFSAIVRSLPGKGPQPPQRKTPEGEEMVRDPQCGTYIPRGDAVTRTVKGERHYFCSTRCRDEFKKTK